MEDRLRPGLQCQSDHCLGDSVGHSGHPENSRSSGLGDLNRLHRRRKVRARGHPVPDLIQVAPQILFEILDRAPIHPGRALVSLDSLVRLPHQLLWNDERLVRRT